MVTFIEPSKLLLIWIHKFYHAQYPIGFNKAVIGDSKKKDENQPIRPDWLFEERCKVLFKLRYYPSNERDV